MIEALDSGPDNPRFVMTARDRGVQDPCGWKEKKEEPDTKNQNEIATNLSRLQLTWRSIN